jgi:predicted HTH domain antitoxin
MLSSTTLRIEHNVLEDVSKMANKLHLDRGTFLRQLVMQAYEERLLDLGIEEYGKGKITIGELAEKTNRNIWEIMDILKERKLPSSLTLKDMEGTSHLF